MDLDPLSLSVPGPKFHLPPFVSDPQIAQGIEDHYETKEEFLIVMQEQMQFSLNLSR